MRKQVEAPAITRVYGNKEVLWYESKVDSYVPNLDYFAESITMNFGSFDPITGTRGPWLGGGTFKRTRPPPNCPTLTSTPGIVPPAHMPKPNVKPAAKLDFQSTLKICLKELASRTIHLKDGGLEVRLDTRWTDASGQPLDEKKCPSLPLTVALERDAYFGWAELNATPVPSGRVVTLRWRHLPDDDYRLVFKKTGNADCCLSGDVIVGTFSAPRMKKGDVTA